MKGKRFLLTGATGFLGRYLTHRLHAEGAEVIALVRETSDYKKIEGLAEFKYYEDGLENLFNSVPPCDAILHLATDYGRGDYSISSQYKTNVVLPLELVERNLLTWKAPFLNTDTYFRKYSETNYLSEYIRTKKIIHSLLLNQFSESGITILNLNLEHIFGPELIRSKFVNKLFLELLENKAEIEFTTALQKRDFIYIKDVVDAYVRILKSDSILSINQFKEIDIGTGLSVSIRDFAQKSKIIIGSGSKLSFGKIPERQNEIQDSYANTGLLESLGWRVNFPLKEAINDCVIKMRENLLIVNNIINNS